MDIRASIEMEGLRATSASKNLQKIKKISAVEMVRTVISASHKRKKWMSDNVTSREFILADIPLNSVATLNSFDGKFSLKASLDDDPIVVDVNKQRTGRTAKQYLPPVIVIHGSGKHAVTRLKGKSTIKAWVGAEAARVMGLLAADSQFGSNELQNKLSEILREKIGPKKNNVAGPYPYIIEVYPFEDYFIYQFEGKMFKQDYKCDIKKRVTTFEGEPEQVIQKYVDLDANMTSMEKAIKMSDVPRQAPMGNKAANLNGNISNATAPGTGVGPRIELKTKTAGAYK
jgi:hypothetical protein